MKRMLLISLVIVLALSAVAVGCGGGEEEGEKVFRVAHLEPLAGPFAGWGLPCQESAELAVEDINADGGVKVGDDYYIWEEVLYDNQLDPTITSTLARKVIYDDEIGYIFVNSTDEGLAISEICNENKVILFVHGPISDIIGPQAPYTFQFWNTMAEQEWVCLQYVHDTYPEVDTVGCFAYDARLGREAAADFTEQAEILGFTVIEPRFNAPGTTDFYSQLTAMLAKNPGYISVTNLPAEDQAHIVKQARELGYTGIIGHPDVLDMETMTAIAGLEALQGNIGQSPDCYTAVGQDWNQRFLADFGSEQTWTRYMYDARMLLELAIEKAGTTDPEVLKDTLGEVKFEGVAGETYFAANKYTGGLKRSLKAKMFCVQVEGDQLVQKFSGYAPLWD